MIDKAQFVAQAERLVHGLLRESLGYSVDYAIPYYRGIAGYMIDWPQLWIRHARFPILFVAYDGRRDDILADIVKQLQNARSTSYFTLLVVVPTRQHTGNEAEELRQQVNGSVYRHDFVVLDRQHLSSIVAAGSSQRLVEIILEQGIDLSSISPYVVRGPVPASMFFGREAEIKAITQSIDQGNYAIVGGRRIGKSSIVQRIDRLLANDPRYRSFYMNCEDLFDRDSFYSALEERFELPSSAGAAQRLRKLVTALRGEEGPRRLVFLLDETDALLDADAATAPWGQLAKAWRALAHERLCSFVFTGSKVLHQHLHDAGSPFFNFCQEFALGHLSERAVAEIVVKPMRQLGITLRDPEAVLKRVFELTSCHPSLVQWLCDRLVTSGLARQIAAQDVERIGASPAFRQYYLETAWGDCSPLEKLVTLLVEEPTFSDLTLRARASFYNLTAETVRPAVDTLKLYSLIGQEGDQYRFLLARFPALVRQEEDAPALMESLRRQVE